jgi:type IV pilus assembly protein PilB
MVCAGKKGRIGEILVNSGQISQEDLTRALAMQRENPQRLGEILVTAGRASRQEVAAAISEIQGIPYAVCPPERIDSEILKLVPRSLAVQCCALPLAIVDKKLAVVLAEPQNVSNLDLLGFTAGMDILPRFSFREDILLGIKKFYGEGSAEDAVREAEDRSKSDGVEFFLGSSREAAHEALEEVLAGKDAKSTAAVRFVSRLIAAAVDRNASDIHIEPRAKSSLVRFRVDGILHDWQSIPASHHSAVISRIKILSDMDIAERRVPQDGRILIEYKGRRLDLRISSLPTHFGEKIVMRILDPRVAQIDLDHLGLSRQCAADLRQILDLPQGTLIVTGPTGSGKSTTLYAALNLVKSPDWNIVTVEDPVEYLVEGVNQVQVHPKAGLTFASTLPSILRQDPDIIMIGEVRDGNTAEIMLRSALTGHMVLSTMHTNDSLSAITRLVDLGIPPYLVASAVSSILAQRLVRRLCGCHKVVPADAAYKDRLNKLGFKPLENEMMPVPVGCFNCNNKGYKGRVGIYELLVLSEPICAAIQQNSSLDQIRTLARGEGFRTMQEDAIDKVRSNMTTLDEVQRIVPFENSSGSRCENCAHMLSLGFRFCPYCGELAPETESNQTVNPTMAS